MKKSWIVLFLSLVIFSQCGKPAAEGTGTDVNGEKAKMQLTAYSEYYELFAESDLFVKGKECSLLAHFTHLADFKPLVAGNVILSLEVAGQTLKTEQAKPVRPGIYRFTFTPDTVGNGRLAFAIAAAAADTITINDLVVHATMAAAYRAQPEVAASAQAVTFTKEKSWKVDFATELPQIGAFGEVIQTVARIQSAQGDEAIVSAKAGGVVRFSGEHVLEGRNVTAGQRILSIAGGGLADNNMAVRFAEARNNFQRAKADYERSKDLAGDRIISEKELLKARNEYDNAKAAFDNLDRNFGTDSQEVTAPFAGFVKQVFVQNGQFVNAGQPIVSISQNRKLVLRADVRQKYAPILAAIVSATIRTLYDDRTYTLEQLNGRILSYGQSVNDENFMIPISVQVEKIGGLLPGGFVEIYFKTAPRATVLSVANPAILEDQGNYFVFVQLNPEQFEKREVRIGAGDGLRTEVLDGIIPSERVVSKGAIWVKLAQGSGELDAHSGHVH